MRRQLERVPVLHTSAAVALSMLVATAGCNGTSNASASATRMSTLRIGVPAFASISPQVGLRQLFRNQSGEGLGRVGEDGRPVPWLAKGWTVSPNGLSLTVELRPGAKFHDGSPVLAAPVAEILKRNLPEAMGEVFEDIDAITADNESTITIRFRRPSPFLLESLETPIQKTVDQRVVGTGPFINPGPNAPTEMEANRDYYLGRPVIDRLVVSTYPSVRTSWAEMLRGNLDMLYEVGSDALDSMKGAESISVFTYVRHYQYLVAFNVHSPVLRSPEVRRALNRAVDRSQLVHDALDGHGVPSTSPISPRHWALRSDLPDFRFDPGRAAAAISAIHHKEGSAQNRGVLRFTCLVPPDPSYQRIALVLKRQLQAVGVEMSLEEASQDRILQAITKRDFEAVLFDPISGPSLLRLYLWWHSGGPQNPGGVGTPAMDVALERIRHAASEDEYRSAVAGLQQTVIDDPPAIFLAWSERARAISRRFDVPVEPGRDVLSTIRLWRAILEERVARKN